MNASLRIEPARAEDIEAVRRLLSDARLPIDDLDPSLLADFLVARTAAGVVGVVGLQVMGDVALLRSLAVEPTARGLGVAARLLDAIEGAARDRRISALFLLTTSAAPYFAARGYAPAAREDAPAGIRGTAQFAGLCPASSTFMAKTL